MWPFVCSAPTCKQTSETNRLASSAVAHDEVRYVVVLLPKQIPVVGGCRKLNGPVVHSVAQAEPSGELLGAGRDVAEGGRHHRCDSAEAGHNADIVVTLLILPLLL